MPASHRYIVKCQNDPTSWKGLSKESAFGEVDEVREALWQHHRLVYNAYDHYACLYSESEHARSLITVPGCSGLKTLRT